MAAFKPIKKAVFPVAGLGTRFLPATKSIPKEMLPIVDKPLIQYAVEEAIAAGIETLVFVTSRKKHAISDHFDTAFELETKLNAAGKTDLARQIREIIPEHIARAHVPQLETRGLGHAVLCARAVVGNEPFAVILADDMIKSPGAGCLQQMVDIYEQHGSNIIAVQEVPRSETKNYGILEISGKSGVTARVDSIVEKPEPEQAPSTLAVVGRYILNPEIFDELEKTTSGAGGEIQLTDAIASLIRQQELLAYEFEGIRYDCGSKIGFVKATVDYALDDAEMRDELLAYVGRFIN